MVRRGSWGKSSEITFQGRDSFRERTGDDGHLCSRGIWCCGVTLTRNEDGTTTRVPAATPRAFCHACETRIGACLDELPSAFVRLSLAIGDRPASGQAVRVPFGPRLLLRSDVDALMRDMAFVLGSWHERVATVDHLSVPEASPHALAPMVATAVTILALRLSALLALAPEPMLRVMPPKAAEAWEDGAGAGGVVRPDAQAHMLLPLSGADAGQEILDLHYRARSILGETRSQPERFDGIPCRSCEAMGLERAEPPSDPEAEAMHSRCPACGDAMDRKDFGDWVKRYEAWAKGAGLPSCRRCQGNRHQECCWPACPCKSAGHPGWAAA